MINRLQWADTPMKEYDIGTDMLSGTFPGRSTQTEVKQQVKKLSEEKQESHCSQCWENGGQVIQLGEQAGSLKGCGKNFRFLLWMWWEIKSFEKECNQIYFWKGSLWLCYEQKNGQGTLVGAHNIVTRKQRWRCVTWWNSGYISKVEPKGCSKWLKKGVKNGGRKIPKFLAWATGCMSRHLPT